MSESFRFYDKVVNKEYHLPRHIATATGEMLDLQTFLGHVISTSRKRFRSSDMDRKNNIPSADVKQ